MKQDRRLLSLLLSALFLLSSAGCGLTRPAADAREALEVIAFGSCAAQDKPQPIWDAVIAQNPDLFLFIGDNIYADTEDRAVMRAKYEMLGAQPGYQKLLAETPLLAVWDDHDYGLNDAGAEYAMKEASQQEFIRFYNVPEDSPIRQRPGIYDARIFGPPGRRVQVILLDTRYFRGPLNEIAKNRYAPNEDPRVTMLGEAQWTWLEEQLRQPAEVRIIASSIQVVPEEHASEKWANLPHERDRLFRLIRETGAEGVLFISGDRHKAELSRLGPESTGPDYPLYDLTSSSLNRPSGDDPDRIEPNRYRIGERQYLPVNFGLITFDWQRRDPLIGLEIRDLAGDVVLEHEVPLSTLK